MNTAQPLPSDTTFEAHRHAVYGWAYRIVGSHHDALDIAQDVYLRWVDQLARDVPDNPVAWLRRVTINRAIDVQRARRMAGQVSDGLGDVVIDVAKTQADTETLRDDLAQTLDTLTEPQRAVLIAKVFDELTFAQIAHELGVAIPTVKTHYVRALSTARDRLARHWGPGA